MRLLLAGVISVNLFAVSTVNEPDDLDTVTTVPFDLTLTVDSQPTLASVDWYINSTKIGTVSASPWALSAAIDIWNGSHTVYAVLKNASGAVLETTATNTFTLAFGSDTIAVTPSIEATSPWSGDVTFAVTITRADGQTSDCYLYVDGVFVESQEVSGTTCNNLNIDTRTLENGPRRIFVQASNAFTNVARGMWERVVTVSNTATAPRAVESYATLFLAVAGTATIPCRIRFADSSSEDCTTDLPVTEDFNRADETTLSGSWTTVTAGVKIVSNVFTGNDAATSVFPFAIWNGDTFPADQYAQVKIAAVQTTKFVGAVVRGATNGNNYNCGVDGTDLGISRTLGGVLTNLATGAVSFAANDVLRCEVSGVGATVTIRAKKNGAEVLTVNDTDSSRLLYGQAGVITYLVGGTTGDDFEAGALDGTSEPAALYSSADTGVASVNSSGVVTGVGVGDTAVTVRSRGLTDTIRVSVNTANILPHFSRNGTTLTSYTPGESMLLRSWFFSAPSTLTNMVSEYADSGSNVFEETFYKVPNDGESEAAYEARVATFEDEMEAFKASSGLSMLGIGDGMARDQSGLYKATRGIWRTWTPDPVTAAFEWAKTSGVMVAAEMVDEVSFSHGNNPFPPGLVGTGGFTNIVSNGAGLCTANWTDASTNGAHLFILSGAVTDPDLNSTTGNLFTATNIATNSFDFSCPGVGAGTYNSTSDAELTMQMLASIWVGEDYVRYTAFQTIRDLADAASSHSPLAWPVSGSADQLTKTNWNAPEIADYTSMYWAASRKRQPYGQSVPDMILDMRTSYEGFYEVMQRDKPWLMLTPAAGPMYRIGGIAVAVDNIDADGVVTFDAAHGISSVTRGLTRIDVTGSSDLNGDFYVITAPTSTTTRVVYKAVVNTGTGFGGTALFDTGVSLSVYSLQVDGSTHNLQINPVDCRLQDQLFHTFTLSGNSNSALNRTWYFSGPTAPSCENASAIMEVPGIASTGGTAYVITTNAYVPGRNQLMIQGVYPRNVLAGIMWSFIAGAAGVRNYALSNVNPDDDANASRWFQDEPSSGDGINYNSGPLYNVNGMVDRWNAAAVGTQTVAALESLFLQPQLPVADYGAGIECTRRSGASAGLIGCINITDGYLARDFDVSQLSGAIVRHRLTIEGDATALVSGTTDSLTIGPGETILWASQTLANQSAGKMIISGRTVVQ